MRASTPLHSGKSRSGASRNRIAEGPPGAEEREGPRRVLAPALSVCPFCACGCGLYFPRSKDGLIGVMPSERHPVSRGRLCARGWAAHEASIWGRRLTRPLVRRGNAQEPADWETAIGFAAQRLGDLLTAGKPIGVLGSGRATNEDNFQAVRLARRVLRTGHVDSCLRGDYQALLYGVTEESSRCDLPSALDDLEHCDVIVLLEGDLAASHPRVAFAIMRALRLGARLVTLGPVRTQMSRLSWLHLPLIPGDEPVLVARLANAAEFAIREVHSADGAASESPASEAASRAHLMPSEELRRAVTAYMRSSRAALVLAPTGAPAPWLQVVAGGFARLAAASGHLHRAGSVLLPLPLRANTRGALEMGASPNCLPGLRALEDDAAQWRLHRVWQGDLTVDRGLDVEAMIREVRGLVVLADDPPVSLPSEKAARKALSELECLVVLDAFVTPTVEAAHVAFPIPSLAETEGTLTNMAGRVQWLQACASPPGEGRPGWQVLAELSGALGMPADCQTVDEVFRGILAGVPSYEVAFSPEEGEADRRSAVLPVVSVDERTRAAVWEDQSGSILRMSEGPRVGAEEAGGFPLRLIRATCFDMGLDPLSDFSPTLRREVASRRKLFPHGFVEMNVRDADALGIRQGWRVRVKSLHGEVEIPVHLRRDLEPGVMVVPFSFRDHLRPVMDGRDAVDARVERT